LHNYSRMPPKKEPKEQGTCSICCNTLNKSKNKPVACNFCTDEACLECVKHYILDTHGDFHCMFCRNKWNRDVLVEKLPQVFLKEELREHQEKKIVEIEKARLPAAQTIAENRIKLKNIQTFREAVSELFHSNTGVQDKNDSQIELLQLIARNYGIEDDIKLDTNMITVITNLEEKVKTEEVKRNYVRNCPNNSCRGFINEEWNCGLCGTKMCKKCFEQVDDEKSHKCDPNIIESNKLIAKDSKPCPKCNCLITKLSGCFAKDQKILLYNQKIKLSQDIEVGDELIGDDGEKRIVQTLIRGEDDMYEISQDGGETYIVNSKHKLILSKKDKIVEITVDDYNKLTLSEKSILFGLKIVNGLQSLTTIDVTKNGKHNYYGWSVDKNKRFLLPDKTVVHNCDQMFCVSCHTAFSWERGTIEKGVIHNPHFYQWQKTLQVTAVTQTPAVDLCNENYFPSISDISVYQKTYDSYTEKWLFHIHQYILHLYLAVRPSYLTTSSTDLKMEINVNYMMTAFGKTEWKKRLYEADRRQEMARDMVELIDMVYAISGERFRNFIRERDAQHIKDVGTLLVYTMDEFDKIKKRHMIKSTFFLEQDWLVTLRNSVKSI
jgi:hypothetical protein